MDYIDPHIHMISRITDDYERMAQCGCVAVSEPAFWAGFDRGSAEGFRDYFRHLTEIEPKRAAQFGIRLFYLGAMLLLAICVELIKGLKIPVGLVWALIIAFFAMVCFGWLFIHPDR
jgi:hypothetical protein